ncbi:Serine/threonine-protein kinase KIC1 [Spathaspora sp. JA1]|nr:Serine/threonine-protein kinase KIC1 [Spathaspora sp. JA1]
MNASSLYKRTEVIGRGKFGIVYKGYNKQTKQVVAIKVLNLDTEEDEVIDVQQEIQFLTELKNVPNVTHYYGSLLNDTKLWIIMDYCAGGSLRTLLKAGVLEERYIGVIVRELLIALSGVHKMSVIHRDLKAANVLITKEGNVQLCDFGVAAKITSNALKRTTMAGTPYWMAPEVIRTGETYNSKADIWSLGITIYEIATGNPPYCDQDASWAMQLISKSKPPRLEGREFSPALKECIALCLDENPDERPSADDLYKCKLVKLYKNYPKSILREVISKYLLWRDRNSARDSVFINLEDEQSAAEQPDIPANNNSDDNHSEVDNKANHNHQIQVKWDFDSLSSREYIIENDIDMDHVQENYNMNYDDTTQGGDYYQTLPTLKAGTTVGRNQSTIGLSNIHSSSATLNTNGKTITASDVPKSLQMLFEDSPDQAEISSSVFQPPVPTTDRMESPTIEIPDMDNLVKFPNVATTSTTSSHPPLDKPPTLYHSQSASASLESRYTTANTSPVETRPRKKTISNTIGSGGAIANVQQQQQQLNQPSPHTPPYTATNNLRTPSPKPPSATALVNSTTGLISKSNSPSKMKALQTPSNPLLQPINFKLPNDNASANSQSPPTIQQQPPQLLTQHSMPAIPVSASSATSQTSASNNLKTKRNRPGFHIQMPTPSNTIHSLAALTNDQNSDNENVNQFGINPAQAANMPVSMTPVTEKEIPNFTPVSSEDGEEGNQKSQQQQTLRTDPVVAVQRPHGNSISVQEKAAPLSTTTTISPAISAPAVNPASNVFVPRGNSFSGTLPTPATAPAASTGLVNVNTNTSKFPVIPSINGDFFIDSTSKQRLVSELESMIKLFNQGLEALEENI